MFVERTFLSAWSILFFRPLNHMESFFDFFFNWLLKVQKHLNVYSNFPIIISIIFADSKVPDGQIQPSHYYPAHIVYTSRRGYTGTFIGELYRDLINRHSTLSPAKPDWKFVQKLINSDHMEINKLSCVPSDLTTRILLLQRVLCGATSNENFFFSADNLKLVILNIIILMWCVKYVKCI